MERAKIWLLSGRVLTGLNDQESKLLFVVNRKPRLEDKNLQAIFTEYVSRAGITLCSSGSLSSTTLEDVDRRLNLSRPAFQDFVVVLLYNLSPKLSFGVARVKGTVAAVSVSVTVVLVSTSDCVWDTDVKVAVMRSSLPFTCAIADLDHILAGDRS